jgi:hypothetical protein
MQTSSSTSRHSHTTGLPTLSVGSCFRAIATVQSHTQDLIRSRYTRLNCESKFEQYALERSSIQYELHKSRALCCVPSATVSVARIVLPCCLRGGGLGLEVPRWKLMHTVPRLSDSTTCARADR